MTIAATSFEACATVEAAVVFCMIVTEDHEIIVSAEDMIAAALVLLAVPALVPLAALALALLAKGKKVCVREYYVFSMRLMY